MAIRPDHRVVAIRKGSDQSLNARQFGCGDEAVGIGGGGEVESRYIFGERSRQKLYILRHVAEMAPEFVFVPMGEIVIAYRDAAAARHPCPYQGSGEA